jgi:tRNA(Ile)-lysidine synthase
MDLAKKFKEFVAEKKLFSGGDEILLAVSGGVDSVVMTELFSRARISFGIAHCNFQLRGDESEADEKFVRKLAVKYDVPFFTKRFETKEKGKQKLSVQERARKQRYEWFAELIQENGYTSVATAHHLNDVIETFFINLLRGTGISGLRGIPVKLDSPPVIRPMLFARKQDIEKYAAENNLSFRLDHSNETDLYLRNKLRHHLMPVLLQLNPQFEKVMERNVRNLAFAEEKMKEQLNRKFPGSKKKSEDHLIIAREELENSDYPVETLMSVLQSYGFNNSQSEDAWNARTGSQFFAGDYVLTCDRRKFIIAQNKAPAEENIPVALTDIKISIAKLKISLNTKQRKADSPLPVSEGKNIFLLDKHLLEFPLGIRPWKQGDSFYPLGMKGRKKISDFLTDRKVSRPDKEKTYVLLSGDKIACVLGHRIDERYKVTNQTKEIYRIEVTNG